MKIQTELMLAICLLPAAAGAELFRAVEPSSGFDFQHFNGMTGKTHFAEMMGSGAALLDYDGDGDMDLYLVQGASLGPGETRADALIDVPHERLVDRLYRNDGPAHSPRFVDVTKPSGLKAEGYGMGVAVGDIDNDGDPDLFVANFGANELWINRGDGTFENATTAAGLGDERWSVGASFADFDGDGWLDLYVVNYVNFSLTNAKTCRSHFDAADYCSPQSYEPVSDRLYRNRGADAGSRFVDVSARAGIAGVEAPGLGVVSGDFNADGRLDFYVANDGAGNLLWLNQGQGRFIDDALLAGVAVNMQGAPEASMGVDAADFDADGDLDLFMTHLDRQTNTLYVNDGNGWFSDRSGTTALGKNSFAFTGFGTRWFDYDNDGWLDLASINGAVVKVEEQVEAGLPLPLQQTNQLWRNAGGGNYEETTDAAGRAFSAPAVGRGLAIGDVNSDGLVDLLITNNGGAARLLLGAGHQANAWIGLDVRQHGRPALGALVEIRTDGRTLMRTVRSDGSYASAHDPRVIVGLAGGAGPVSAAVTYVDGSRRTFDSLDLRQYHRLDGNN